MYTVKHGGDILRGDLVAVSNSNDFTIGIYYGQGRGGTFQYFTPKGVVNSKEWWEKSQKDTRYAEHAKPWKITRIWKSYVNTPRDTRIMKLNKDNITDQKEIENIEKAKEILQEFNITVNY